MWLVETSMCNMTRRKNHRTVTVDCLNDCGDLPKNAVDNENQTCSHISHPNIKLYIIYDNLMM